VSKKWTTIKQVQVIPATPQDVFLALVYARKHSEFTGAKVTGQPKVGGRFSAWDGYISGKHLKLSEGKRIIWEWKTAEWPRGYPASIVDFRLRKKRGNTELRMVHSKVPAEQAASYRQGWIDFYWKPMKEYFKTGPGSDRIK